MCSGGHSSYGLLCIMNGGQEDWNTLLFEVCANRRSNLSGDHFDHDFRPQGAVAQRLLDLFIHGLAEGLEKDLFRAGGNCAGEELLRSARS